MAAYGHGCGTARAPRFRALFKRHSMFTAPPLFDEGGLGTVDEDRPGAVGVAGQRMSRWRAIGAYA